MRNKYFLLFIICTLALALRLWGLEKPLGLWNDEYLAWHISSFDFPDFFKRVFYNCHMPLYYLVLKAWSAVFSDSDLSLRLSSVLTGLLCVISMFFLGKEYKDEKAGLYCALATSISGFMIYFSQEVRLYSLIFLITTWVIFFFIRTLKTPTKQNFSLYLISNFLLLLTHTIGFVFVFFNLLVFSVLITKQKPDLKPAILRAYLVLGILSIPILWFIFVILTRDSISQNWGFLNFSRIFFVFSDYLTPLQLNLVNAPQNVISHLSTQSIFTSILFFGCPILCSLYFIGHTLKEKSPILRPLGIIGVLTFAVLVIAALLGKLVLTTKYSIEIYPIILLELGVGMSLVHSSKLGKTLISLYITSILFYLIFAPNAPQKLPRQEGHKAPVMLLEKANVGENDTVIGLYHQFYRYQKYIKTPPKTFYDISKEEVAKYIFGAHAGESYLKHNGKNALRPILRGASSSDIDTKIAPIFENLNKGERVAIIVPKQVAFLSSGDLARLANDDARYQSSEIIFLAFSFAKIKFINMASRYCDIESVNELGTWAVVTFVRR